MVGGWAHYNMLANRTVGWSMVGKRAVFRNISVHTRSIYLGGTLRRSKTMVYAVRNGAARCRQGVSSAALATYCLGRGNATGAEEIAVYLG
jgi:hypothetical protein